MSMVKPKKQCVPGPRDLVVKPATYQPSKADLEEQHDMFGMNKRQIRSAFFRPFKIVEKD